MGIRAIVWDMDGLLVDSEPAWDQARRAIARRHGVTWTRADHINVMGVSTAEWTAYMIGRLGLDMPPAALETLVIDELAALYAAGIPFRSHAVGKVRWGAARYPSCIASGSPRRLIDAVAGNPLLAPHLAFTLAADEVGAGKPDPAIYLEAARRLGVDPADCLCIEDSANGVLAGHRAGMKVINVPDPAFPLTPEQARYADLVLPDLAALTDGVLAGLAGGP